MENSCTPRRQGLYDPRFEHDACGIGLVADIKGRRSRTLVEQALAVLRNLSHRGGVGSEPNSGDGAGILLQLPHAFFEKAVKPLGFALPAAGDYAAGIFFLPHDGETRRTIEQRFAAVVQEQGQLLLGWRDVPVDPSGLGKTARDSMPFFRQVFIGRRGCEAGLAFERRLYVIRRLAENAFRRDFGPAAFYCASLSSRTIVYKGMLTAEQLDAFYTDLRDETVDTGLALVHSRYSTNTFPSWDRAHPNRYIIHNGEINTLRGNVNSMNARQGMLKTDVFGTDLSQVLPVINPDGSDSAMFDNTAEFLMLSGMPLDRVMMLMVPEPWEHHESMREEVKAYYEYSSCLMEPWDGPAAMGFTDGVRVGAVLDRNGLRPARYYVTSDDMLVLASEAGVLDIPPEKVVRKERLHPGRMLLVDTAEGRIIDDAEIKQAAAAAAPYGEWLAENRVAFSSLKGRTPSRPAEETSRLSQLQKAFGYTYEDLRMVLAPMAKDGVDPIGAMGNDVPLAVLSKKPQLLYDYFKQLFAQVTNPPIDALRETIVTSARVLLGSEGNLLSLSPANCRRIAVEQPVIDNDELDRLRNLSLEGFSSVTLPILFNPKEGGAGLDRAMLRLCEKGAEAVKAGANILILSDRGVDEKNAAIPALLAVSGLHQYLIREGLRTRTSLVLESGEPREVHHFAVLIGFGASLINPYLALSSSKALCKDGFLTVSEEEAVAHYKKAANKGVVKIISKMGISTVHSYIGAQIFEALGLASDFVDRYFTETPSRIGGIGSEEVAREAAMRHEAAFGETAGENELDSGGKFQYRRNGELHMFNPETIHKLQQACRAGDYGLFNEYTDMVNDRSRGLYTLRGLLKFKEGQTPVPLDEVESVESICTRFKTGAMSFGSISKEAHEAMAIAMNRIGGKSNTGEGGEDPARFVPDENGDSRRSAIKQVASGRFGVTSEYLVNAIEIQIKMAQGAKPGEGGQLPGRKVYPWVARVRYSTPGVGLISPPPHHDIYSIEDLKQLIHDLKCANPAARISVKLVSEAGVGTIAAGVAKALADVILISGYDGGTGASPRTSIRHAGLPWELGLAETHQTLLLNDLRSRVVIETDGKLLSGRDVAIAALLGAEEFGFATAPLVILGCVMMRVCNLDTCPVGVATQNPALRAKFAGDPAHVVNFMHFIARQLREIMASLGIRTLDEMVGRTDLLETDEAVGHWKTKGLDLSAILAQPETATGKPRRCTISQDHGLADTLDRREILALCAPAVADKTPVSASLSVHNTDRAVGTILGSEISKKYGSAGLPDGTINLRLSGTAGQSFGAFLPHGITLSLSGDANDYIGKGLSGGRIAVYPPEGSPFKAEENIIVGNVALYGATSGEAYINGVAGERFCVRNSGAKAVVEAVGDHGCEYMTGGRVAILGPTGRNFAAGMSGGVAYVLDETDDFALRCNTEMVELSKVEDPDESAELLELVQKHYKYTGSRRAAVLLADWDRALEKFVRVMPRDYKRMMRAIAKAHEDGFAGEDALMAAFEANNRDLARVSGN